MEEVLQQYQTLHPCGMQNILYHVLAPLPGDWQHLGYSGQPWAIHQPLPVSP